MKELLILPDGTGGTVTIKNEKDEAVVITVDSSVTAPIVVRGRVRKVMDTGTTQDDAYILGVR